MTHKESQKLNKLQVSDTVKQIFPFLKKPSLQTSALLLAAGLGLSTLFPVYAASKASQTASVKEKTQLISQNNKKVEITLVS